MTKKIVDLVFQLDSNFDSLDTENCNWIDFFNNIIDSGSNRVNVYVVLWKENGLDVNKEFATKLKRKINFKDVTFCECAFDDIENNLFTLSSMKENKKIYLDKENVIFFATSKEVVELLYIQNFFLVFLDIYTKKYDDKENKQINKISKLFINDSDISKYSYESISYEFLTFLEKKEN